MRLGRGKKKEAWEAFTNSATKKKRGKRRMKGQEGHKKAPAHFAKNGKKVQGKVQRSGSQKQPEKKRAGARHAIQT